MTARYLLLAVLGATPLAAQQRAATPAPAQQRPATPPPAQARQVPAVPAQTPARNAAPAPAQRPGAPAAQPAPRPGAPAAQRPGAHPDSTIDSTVQAIDYKREVYNYQGAQRDPFATLLTDASAQTTINDLRLVSVIYDPRGRSVAVVRDKNSTSPHRLRVGSTLGRLRVIQIRPYEVVFQVEEFGFERQQVLTLQRPEVNR